VPWRAAATPPVTAMRQGAVSDITSCKEGPKHRATTLDVTAQLLQVPSAVV
jgi:hypothetical protein